MFEFLKKKKDDTAPTVSCVIRPNAGDADKTALIGSINEITRSLTKPNPWGYCACGEFVLRGVNSDTKRKNKISVFAPNYDAAVTAAQTSLYHGPFELLSDPTMMPPSDNQIAYMGRLGLRLPGGSSIHDVTALLTRYENNDRSRTNTSFLAYAEANGSVRSDLVGNDELYRRAFRSASVPERAALICYFIRAKDTGIAAGDPRADVFFEKDRAFADILRADPTLMAKLQDFDGADLPKLNKSYTLYKTARTYIDGKR